MAALAPLKFLGISCVGVGGTCSVVYVGSSWLSGFSGLDVEDDSIIQTVSDKFSNRLISNSKDRNGVWKARLDKLRKHSNGELDKDLKAIKETKEKTEKDLRDWCEAAKIKPHSGEGNSLMVQGVEAYCTYVIKDQVNKAIHKKDIDTWKPVNKKLMEHKGSLSNEMKELQKKVNREESDELQKWCFESYEKPFKDKNDQLYKDVSSFCIPVKAAAKASVTPDPSKSPTSVPAEGSKTA
ncbi:hypothetical protein MHC_02910 [Mycoplasma haemocanis str. Illinois]|uniref:Uncharacterized protein n=1 Tax=Mycoplasma haemocanis (strain Illinois) TaxID=1111676 RepID=H6N722_MYCHN|nr:hypothetical protein [Mycoplasma haemocanis]AEW45444.1 hypothetical protein MHC_02910 [Mycoplasma haemocanis str. Illinois]